MRLDLPRPDAHHELVYRVSGRYVLDRTVCRGNDDRVMNATHVSLVDTRRNAPVTVGFWIPSGDAASFEVTVTFICTVTDAVAVVRDGVDAQETLSGSCSPIPGSSTWGWITGSPRSTRCGARSVRK